jgi:purine-binding chemotaxis protein CheW
MNLADIRKKANKERDESSQHPSPPLILDLSEKQDILPEPQVISAPAIAAAAAVEYSAALVASEAVEVATSVDSIEFAPEAEAREPEQVHLYDPMEILLAGRAAAGFGQIASLVSPDAVEIEVSDYQELLCFRVGTEQYAINIMEIKEIIKPREITEVPRVPDFISGVLSLRGIIIPVFNMGRRLHLAPVGHSVKERIIVVNRGEELFGILVDEVLQVVKVKQEAIEQPPAVLEGIDRDFVRGIGRHGGRMLILLNLESILDVSLC